MDSAPSHLEQLAARALERGIQPSYFDVFGHEHTAQPEVIEKLIAALGESPRTQPLPETVVLEEGRELPLPGASTVTLESGETLSLDHLPSNLPLGYHTIAFDGGTSHLIVCPRKMYAPETRSRGAGVAISLYGLRSNRNWGVGDLRDLNSFSTWAADALGADFIALNPLHAIANRTPYNTSPYLPASTYYRNFLYLDVEAIEQFQEEGIQKEFSSPEVQGEVGALRSSEFIEYERVAALKLHFLRQCFRTFDWNTGDFPQFLKREGALLEQFALYCALDEHLRATIPGLWIWPEWPEEYRHPDSEACARFRQERQADVMFYCWVQWQLDRQLAQAQQVALQAGMSIGLYHDLALATDRCGCDLWESREHFVESCRVGAPPDDFSPEGQDWSFPPPSTAQHLKDGYRLFAASIRNNARHGGALRMDHVMRLFRLYWIPEGFSARDGTYVHDRWRDLLGILALESHRQKVRIIGEDLGTVTQEMRDALSHWGLLGYRLLYFERNGSGFLAPEAYTETAVASITTHDLPTLAGFWRGIDIEARRNAGLLPDAADYERQMADRLDARQALLDALRNHSRQGDQLPPDATAVPDLTAELRDACWDYLASTPCELFVVNQEELTGETYQQNLPGSTSEYPNWRRKMTVAVEDLGTNPHTHASGESLRSILTERGRLNR